MKLLKYTYFNYIRSLENNSFNVLVCIVWFQIWDFSVTANYWVSLKILTLEISSLEFCKYLYLCLICTLKFLKNVFNFKIIQFPHQTLIKWVLSWFPASSYLYHIDKLIPQKWILASCRRNRCPKRRQQQQD